MLLSTNTIGIDWDQCSACNQEDGRDRIRNLIRETHYIVETVAPTPSPPGNAGCRLGGQGCGRAA